MIDSHAYWPSSVIGFAWMPRFLQAFFCLFVRLYEVCGLDEKSTCRDITHRCAFTLDDSSIGGLKVAEKLPV
jgi:hypothetical protein